MEGEALTRGEGVDPAEGVGVTPPAREGVGAEEALPTGGEAVPSRALGVAVAAAEAVAVGAEGDCVANAVARAVPVAALPRGEG